MDEYARGRMESVKRFEPQAREIIRELSPYMTEVCKASLADDMTRATDMNLILKGSSLGNRCINQEMYFKYHTCIFRSRREGDNRTSEVTRIMTLGDPRWYFYCWHDGTYITKWILLDVDAIRESGILVESDRKPQPFNQGDGYFIKVKILELARIGAIVVCDKDTIDYIFRGGSI